MAEFSFFCIKHILYQVLYLLSYKKTCKTLFSYYITLFILSYILTIQNVYNS
nr:MAG TPA: hypothetical protein [Caudoviricetes sp.]